MAAALEQPPDGRDAWLDEACAGDTRLRQEVVSLLAAHARAGTFLEQAAVASTGAAEAVTDAVHRVVGLPVHAMLGPYRVLRKIGHGGMGAVYLATRADAAFEKDVAIKIMRDGVRNDVLMRRFHDERRILATLDHPNIARLLDAGATADGLPYLVMDYVDGVPIDACCTQQGIGLPDRLRMFRQVCDAVQYAHQHLVIHRDIKPGNILVTGDGTPKLLDFGIAKLLDEHGEQSRTHTGLRAFTLENASPEQVRGEPMHVTSDVYALGVLLYRLVTGQPPYGSAPLSDTALVRAVCDEPPMRPADAARAGTRIQVDAELEWVMLKALRKEPDRRYPSVAQFADDIRRLLEGLPVLAGPDSRRYRARKFLTRHWLAVSAGVLLALSLAGGVTATWWQARRADEQRELAQQRLQVTRRLANSMIFEVNDALADGRTSARALLLTRASEQLDALAAAPADDPALAEELATAYHRLGDIFGQGGGANVGNRGAGLASHRKGLALRSALAEAAPDDLQRRAQLVQSLMSTTYAEDEIAPSFAHARRAVSLAASLVEARPGDLAFSRLLGLAYYALGSQHRTLGETDRAFEQFALAAPLLARVYEAQPTARARRELGLTHKRLGAILVDQRRFDDALVHLRAAVELDTASLGESPRDPTRQRDLSQSNIQLGFALQSDGDPAGALAAYRRALTLREQLATDDPTSIQGRRDVASVLRYIGIAEMRMGRPDQAIGTLQRAVALNREASYKGDDVPALILRALAEAYERQGQTGQASEWGRRALAEYRAQLKGQPGSRRLARGLAAEAMTLGDVLTRLAGRDPGRRSALQREACAVLDEGLRAVRPASAAPPTGEDAATVAAMERALEPCGPHQAGGASPVSSR
jgi:non-specific serine/threonine protein kinase/serine/threonine-protein kinase